MRTRLYAIAAIGLLCGALLGLAPTADAAYDAVEARQLDQDYQRQGFILKWDAARGLPDRILDARFGQRIDAVSGSPEAISEAFLREHSLLLFGTENVDFGSSLRKDGGSSFELRIIKTRESLSGSQVIRQQFTNGVPVDGAIVQVNLNKKGEVMSAINEVDPDVVLVDVSPRISSQEAIDATLASLERVGTFRRTPETELVAYGDAGRSILAWKTDVPLWSPFSDQVAIVDASTGEVLKQRDHMLHCSTKGPVAEGVRIDIDPPVEQPEPANPGFSKDALVSGSGDVLPANPLNGQPDRYGLRDGDPVAGFVENKVLERLDGSGFLRGDYVDAGNSDQPRANEASLVFNYSPDVTDGHFHEVNIYWHLDTMQDYFQTTLGITAANNRQQPAFAHQGEDDNSSYSPSTGNIRFGDGGVDDSEDGEVVLHEYGHAVHDNISGIGGGEAGAISEGFGDYLACTFGDNPLEAEWDATSYNPGPPPYLRRTDTDKVYPDDLVGQVHADGEIMSAAWWDAREALGAEIADQLCIESFFLVGATTTMTDMANAYVQADQAIYGGAHLGIIYSVFGNRGLGPDYLLEIDHAPLGDTEDSSGPYVVSASVAHTSPITGADAVQLHWRMAGDPSYTDVTMTDLGGDQYEASIPGPGMDATIEYWLSATDDQAVSANLPATAPNDVFSFNVGTDLIDPVITHIPLGDQPLLTWPAEVRAAVTDNLGVASVTCDWSLNGAPQGSFPLFVAGGENYAAEFPIPAGDLVFGDMIEYTITAVDGSSSANTVVEGPHSFEIIDAKGVVLLIDDDGSAAAGGTKLLDDKSTAIQTEDRPELSKGASATQMAAALTATGYVVTVETVAETNPATWGDYEVLISSSGANNSPLADAAYRSALVAYAQGGGKLVVEGGEVGYDSASSPGYPDIVSDVIHADDWDGDDSGPLVEVSGQELHPIRTTPHSIGPSIGISYSGNYGDQDSVKPTADAYLVYGTTDEPGNAGILVYDDNPAPGSAQIVYCAFAMSVVSDPAVADQLIENIVDFLLADEGAAGSSISGQVLVQNRETHSGVTVSAGGVTATTDHDGMYTLEGLFPASYTVSAGLDGWETATQVVTLGENEDLTGVDFELRPVALTNVCNESGAAIPDNDPNGVSQTIEVTDVGELADVKVSVDITHTWRNDLIVELTSPAGTTVTLANRTGGSADDIVANYDGDTVPDGPGTMDDFDGEQATGTWTFFVSDNAGADTGSINSWCLDLAIIQEGAVPTLVSGFGARNVEEGIRIEWDARDVSHVEGFQIRRFVDGLGNLATKKPIEPRQGEMSWIDAVSGLEEGTEVTYMLEAVLDDGSLQRLGEGVTVSYAPVRPTSYALQQNAPNPFNPKTEIRFALTESAPTTLRIYDVSGRLVRELVDDTMKAGHHTVVWNGSDHRGQQVSTGTYYYQLRSGKFVQTRSMVLVK